MAFESASFFDLPHLVASVSELSPVVRIRRRLEEELEQRPGSQRVRSLKPTRLVSQQRKVRWP